MISMWRGVTATSAWFRKRYRSDRMASRNDLECRRSRTTRRRSLSIRARSRSRSRRRPSSRLLYILGPPEDRLTESLPRLERRLEALAHRVPVDVQARVQRSAVDVGADLPELGAVFGRNGEAANHRATSHL